MEITHLSLLVILSLGVHRSTSEILLRQKRNWIIDSFMIDEGYNGDYPYSLGHIKVEKDITLFRIKGQGVDEEPLNVLKIIENTGELLVLGPVDYERFQVLQAGTICERLLKEREDKVREEYDEILAAELAEQYDAFVKLTFMAIDKEKNVVDTQLGIHVKILDANDFAPEFDRARYEIRVKESVLQGTGLIIVKATDKDISQHFKEVDMRIVSVSPKSEDVEFYLDHTFPRDVGTISFKGCLDYEKAQTYTIIVEAKDRGKPKQLSSSCTVIFHIEDQNNYFPVFTEKRSQAKVKEDQENVLILRVPVTDRDTVNTPSWRAKFKIEGDTNKHFRITTDTKTNEALLHVAKSLNYEESSMQSINITVENEVPFYTCKVLERSTAGLWKVSSSNAAGGGGIGAISAPAESRQRVSVMVEDVNEAPIFDIPHQSVSVMENVPVGKYLKTFTATDPDIKSANKIAYKIGQDSAHWVTVDSKNGKVTTTKLIDRESSFVNNSIYAATILAVDDGKPPRTSTATLTIVIGDENDHAPLLPKNIIDICQSDQPSLTPITASDQDEVPNAGPFSFKLLGDVSDHWRIDPSHGHSVNLVKEGIVHSGHYELLLEVADLQGNAGLQNLSVTVCHCEDPTKPNCRIRKAASSAAAGAAVGIVFLSLLLLAGLLLLAMLFSCKKEKIPMTDDGFGHLMISNSEKPGTDCLVAFDGGSKLKQTKTTSEVQTAAATRPQIHKCGVTSTNTLINQQKKLQRMSSLNESNLDYGRYRRERQTLIRGSSLRMSLGASTTSGMRTQRGASYYGEWTDNMKAQETLLNKMLYTLQTPSRELGDYQPYVYAEEGDPTHIFGLDAITISDVSFDPDMDLDWKFNNLASVCMPTDSMSTEPSGPSSKKSMMKSHPSTPTKQHNYTQM